MRRIETNLPSFVASLQRIPWFRNLGKPHPRDPEVVRIYQWQDWQGPEEGFCDWFYRFPAVVREHLEAAHPDSQLELHAIWNELERTAIESAIPNVPDYREDEDAWYGPTTCIWHAGYIAALIGCHVRLGVSLPEPIIHQWEWLVEGHWPFDYADEPPGYQNDTLIDVRAPRLMVF